MPGAYRSRGGAAYQGQAHTCPLAQMGWGSIEAALSCAAVSDPAPRQLPPSPGGPHSEQQAPNMFITPAPGEAEESLPDSAIQHIYEIRLSN